MNTSDLEIDRLSSAQANTSDEAPSRPEVIAHRRSCETDRTGLRTGLSHYILLDEKAQ